ncbi:hypothetical protein JCM15831A_14560 [Asaia astilbis]
MLNLLFPRLRRLEAENESLRAQLSGVRLLLEEERLKLWEARPDPVRMLVLVASQNREIHALKSENRALKRQRDRAGRFAPCER